MNQQVLFEGKLNTTGPTYKTHEQAALVKVTLTQLDNGAHTIEITRDGELIVSYTLAFGWVDLVLGKTLTYSTWGQVSETFYTDGLEEFVKLKKFQQMLQEVAR